MFQMKTRFQLISSQIILIWGMTEWVSLWQRECFSNSASEDPTHSAFFSFIDVWVLAWVSSMNAQYDPVGAHNASGASPSKGSRMLIPAPPSNTNLPPQALATGSGCCMVMGQNDSKQSERSPIDSLKNIFSTKLWFVATKCLFCRSFREYWSEYNMTAGGHATCQRASCGVQSLGRLTRNSEVRGWGSQLQPMTHTLLLKYYWNHQSSMMFNDAYVIPTSTISLGRH